MGWILRTFTTRDPQILKHLFKSLVIPNIDYCSQLYMPVQPKGIEKIEKLQMDYLKKNSISEKNELLGNIIQYENAFPPKEARKV